MSEGGAMTREEAERHAAALNEAAEPGTPIRWMVREDDGGGWVAVQVLVPGLSGNRGPLTESTEARPKPEAEDPRDGYLRNIGPYGPA